MPKSKLLKLLTKFAAEPTVMPPGGFAVPPAKTLQDMGYDLQMKFRLVLTEMEHEIGLLKQRGFDPEMFQLFSGVRQHLEKIFRNMNPDDPVKTARELVQYMDNKHNKAVLDNLEFLSKHHVKETNVDFTPNKLMVHPQIRSFGLLPKLAEEAKDLLDKMSPTSLQSTVRPPSRQMPATVIPGLPALPNIPLKTPLPPTSPESPESKKRMEEEVG